MLFGFVVNGYLYAHDFNVIYVFIVGCLYHINHKKIGLILLATFATYYTKIRWKNVEFYLLKTYV